MLLGCTPKKIWLVIRHGTRYPGKEYVRSMIKKLPELQQIILDSYAKNETQLIDDVATLLSEWKVTFTEDDIKNLTEEGENEMIDLAERYQSRFPSLMPEVYDNQTYKVNTYIISICIYNFHFSIMFIKFQFKYTTTQRTEQSAKNFATGLFGRQNSHKVQYLKAEHRDRSYLKSNLQPFNFCG